MSDFAIKKLHSDFEVIKQRYYRHKDGHVYAKTYFLDGYYFTDVGKCENQTYVGKTHQSKEPFDFSNFEPISEGEYRRFIIHDCIYS